MTQNGLSNLLPGTAAMQRSSQNEQVILHFLRQEKFTKTAILENILAIKTRSGITKILRKMEAKSLLKKHVVNSILTVWGITNEGLHAALNGELAKDDLSYFIPSRLNLTTLEHTFDCQRVHSLCIKYGLEYQAGSNMGSRATIDKIPDGIITTVNGKVAIEVERHLKTRQRYDAIIYNYLKCIKKHEYQTVLYIAPDKPKREQIYNVFHSLENITMTVGGQRKKTKLNKEAHLKFFKFISGDELESVISKLIQP